MKTFNIKYPIVDNNFTNTFLGMSSITKDVYRSDLLLLLLTQKGERYYMPDYGTNLVKFIFEPNDAITASDVEKEIKDTVSLYMPAITVTSVVFDWVTDIDGNPIKDSDLSVKVLFTYNEGTFVEEGVVDIKF